MLCRIYIIYISCDNLLLPGLKYILGLTSLKSDILPLINIGAEAIHVPFHTTWQHEKVTKKDTNGAEYKTVEGLSEILNFFKAQ